MTKPSKKAAAGAAESSIFKRVAKVLLGLCKESNTRQARPQKQRDRPGIDG
jgi:hypothetical protein